MEYLIAAVLAGFIGYRVGLQNRWSWWHGPLAAVFVMPLAMDIGFDATLSVVAPVCLASGFMGAQWVG